MDWSVPGSERVGRGEEAHPTYLRIGRGSAGPAPSGEPRAAARRRVGRAGQSVAVAVPVTGSVRWMPARDASAGPLCGSWVVAEAWRMCGWP